MANIIIRSKEKSMKIDPVTVQLHDAVAHANKTTKQQENNDRKHDKQEDRWSPVHVAHPK